MSCKFCAEPVTVTAAKMCNSCGILYYALKRMEQESIKAIFRDLGIDKWTLVGGSK